MKELHKGVLMKIDTQGLTVEQWVKKFVSDWIDKNEPDQNYKNDPGFNYYWAFYGITYDTDETYVFAGNNEVYKIIKDKEYDNDEEFAEITKNQDGTYNYLIQFDGEETELDKILGKKLNKLKKKGN